ncbi:MAG TPA: lamin tail domain-containing protein [Symbiobacteriaceae bacterium]|nr:lamin tail domain-containing protein [Symbiobacteriaceae bacterium]
MKKSPLQRALALMISAPLVLAQVVAPPGAVAAQASSPPELLITEIVPASSGTGQPYEFVEIYNPTTEPISLNNYKLLYYTSSPYTSPANRWMITDKQIPAGESLVLWLKKFDYPNVPLADFNQNYGVNLSPDQVFEVRLTTSAQGLHDSSKRRVAITRPDESVISAAYINDGVADGTGKANKSVTYRYAGQTDVAKIANGQLATPGEILPEQDPNAETAPPAAPTDLTATPQVGAVALQWAPNTEPDLNGYRVYKDGAPAADLPATETATVISGLDAGRAYNFQVSALDTAGNESELSAAVHAVPLRGPVPPLLITELVADTDNHYAGYDAFEFVELYNASAEPINLQGYKLQMATAGNLRWERAIDHPVTLAPGKTAVLWTRRGELAAMPAEAFNLHYFATYPSRYLPAEALITIDDVSGLFNTEPQTVILADPAGAEIARATYNDPAKEIALERSVTYAYPLNGGSTMRKLQAGVLPTPGHVDWTQVPPADPTDVQAPAAPGALTAEAGAGSVALTWAAATAPDLAAYNLYKNGQWELSVPAAQTSTTVYLLTGGVTYDFAVTAVDASGNESTPSPHATATPAHQVITQQELIGAEYGDLYPAFWNSSTAGPIVPGLTEDLVPQGAAYWADQDLLLLSNYLDDGRPTVLTLVKATSGALVKTLHLYQEDGSAYIGHAGGLAVSTKHLWVASGSAVYRIPLSDLLAAPDNGEIHFAGRIPTETNASFTAYADNILWVGEFHHPPTYQTDPSHKLTSRDGKNYGAWIVGYRLDNEFDQPSTPDFVLSIPDRIQGMAVSGDSIVLSQSFGRNNNSTLFRYAKPDLAGAPDQTVTVNGSTVPLWFLDGLNQAPNYGALTLPPLAEGLVSDGDRLFVLFESGANQYRHTAYSPLDRLRVLSLERWAAYDTISLTGQPPVLEVGYQAKLNVLHHLGFLPEADVTVQADLSVSDEAIATIEPDGTVTARAPGEVTITAQFQGKSTTLTLKVVELDQVRLAGPGEDLKVGQTAHLRLEAVYKDGSVLTITEQATFTTALGGELFIAEGGLLKAIKPGIVEIQATYHGQASNPIRVLVRPAK